MPGMLSALDLARRIEAGEITPRAVVDMCAEAIAAREKEVHAFVVLDLVAARQAAENPKLPSTPLRGLPVGFKDIFDTADFPTQYGSPIYAGFQPRADAAAVALTRRAGGIVIGKTVTTEFATMVPAATRNPHNLAHTPGGSSSGSCAAIAAGMLPIAFGSQTAGSVIRPAAFCRIAGIADVAFVPAAVTGRDLRVDRSTPAPPRIALVRSHLWPQASPAMQQALECAARSAAAAGAKVVDVTLPPIFEEAYAAQIVIQEYETLLARTFEYDRHRDRLGKQLREALDAATAITTDAYDAARRTAKRARQGVADTMAGHDVILTPSAPGTAPHGLGSTGNPMFNRLWTLMGTPCVNVPGLSEGDLPLGIQIVGRFGRDRAALEAALFVERAIA